jgi:hypothetical protein
MVKSAAQAETARQLAASASAVAAIGFFMAPPPP